MGRHILAYHAVTDRFEPSAATVSTRRFREHCSVLSAAGWRAVRLDELSLGGCDRTFCITVDDAYENLLSVVSICERYGWRGTAFVPPLHVGESGRWDVGAVRKQRHLDWNGLQRVAAAGWELGVHGHSHAALTDKPLLAALCELEEARAAIERETGVRATSLAYPFGAVSADLAAAALGMGFSRGVTMDPRPVSAECHPMLWPRWPVYRMDTSANLLARFAGPPWLRWMEQAKTRTIQRFSFGTRVRMMGETGLESAERHHVE